MTQEDKVIRCNCLCHVGGVTVLHIPPDVRCPVSAVTACQACLNEHVPALTCKEWPIVPKPNPLLLPWVDAYPPTESEGKE